MKYRRDEHRVHWVVYHLMWCPKRRSKVLVGNIARDCHKLIKSRCSERGWLVLDLAVKPDHVRLRVMVWPTDSAAEVIKECKALTSHELRLKYPALLKLPSLWTRSYLASTASVDAETAIQYIEAQSKS
jgi:putative transposase